MTAFSFDTPTLLRLQMPRYARVRIRLIGCGGTGSHLATGLGAIARELIDRGTPCDLVFIDGDRVESKNVGRQLFSAGDVGRHKAEVLARRVGAAFNLPALAVTRHVATAKELAPGSAEPGALHLLVGAVDNPAARAHLAGAVKEAHGDVWALDCGNENHSGQVLVGNSADPRQLHGAVALGMLDHLPSPYLVLPDLVQTPKAKRAASCAEATAAGEQGLMVNRMMAAWALAMLHDLLLGTLNYFGVWVNLQTGGVRTWPLDLPTLSEASGLSPKELEHHGR